MPFTDYVRNSLARPVLLEVLAFSLLAFSFSSRGHWNAFSLRLTLAHLHRFIHPAPADDRNEEAQVEELVQRLETLVRNAPDDDARRPHLERALDSLQSLHSHSQPDGAGASVNTHGACMSPRMLGLGPLLHSSTTPLSLPRRPPLSPMSPLALNLALDRPAPDPHTADVQQSQPHGLLLNLSDPALDGAPLRAGPANIPETDVQAPRTPVQQLAHVELPQPEPHLDDPAFFFRALLLSPRHQRPAQPRTATTPTRRDDRPVLPLLRERALSAPHVAYLPALSLNLPPSPSLPLPAAPQPYSDDEGDAILQRPITPVADSMPSLSAPSVGLPAAPASPCSDDERDLVAPLPCDRPPLPPVDTSESASEPFVDVLSPITFAPAPRSPVREMSPVRFAPPSPTVAALPRAEERDWPAFPVAETQDEAEPPLTEMQPEPELHAQAEVEVEVEPVVVADDADLPEDLVSQAAVEEAELVEAAVIPAPVSTEGGALNNTPLSQAIDDDETAPLILTVHEDSEVDSDSEGVTLDVVPVLPVAEDTSPAASAVDSQIPASEPESAQEEEGEHGTKPESRPQDAEEPSSDDALTMEDAEESQGPTSPPVIELALDSVPSPLLIPVLLDEGAITPVSLSSEAASSRVSLQPGAVDVPLPPSRPSSALQQIEDDITRSLSDQALSETASEADEAVHAVAEEEEEDANYSAHQDKYFDLSASSSLAVSNSADQEESPVSTGASSPLTRENLRQLALSHGGPRESVSGGSLAWSAHESAVGALEAALHKLRTMRSSGSLTSLSPQRSPDPSPLHSDFLRPSGTSTPSPLRGTFAPAPAPISEDVSPTFSQFSFTTESPTEDDHEHGEPEPASDVLPSDDARDEAPAIPLPKPKPRRKSSKTLLDVPSTSRRRASHLDVPMSSTPPRAEHRRASHMDFPRSAILQDDESTSDGESEVAPLSLDQILDEVFPSASPEVHPVPSRTIERVPSFDFDFHRAGEEEDRSHWRDSVRFPGSESRDSLPSGSRTRTKSGKFVKRVLSKLHLRREEEFGMPSSSKTFNASTVSLAPSTPPRSATSSNASSSVPHSSEKQSHTRRSSKSSNKDFKTQRSRTVSLFSTLSSRRTAMTTPEPVPPVPPVPQAGPSSETRSRTMSLFSSGLGMPDREHGAVEGRRRSMSLFKRNAKKNKAADAEEPPVPPVPVMPPMPHSHSAPAGELTITPGKGKRRDRTLSVFSTLSSRNLVGRYDNAAADEFGTLVGSEGRPQKSRPGSSASSSKHVHHPRPEGTVAWTELIKPHPHPRARSSSPSPTRARSMSPRRPSGDRRMSISNIAKHPPTYVEPHRPALAVLSSSVRRRTMSAGTVDARRSVSWAGIPRAPPNTHKRSRTMSATGPPQPSPVQEEQWHPADSAPALMVKPRPQRERILSNSFIQYLAHTKSRSRLPEEVGGSVRSAASGLPLPGPEEETVKERRERGRVRTRLVSLVSRVSKKGTQ